MQFEVKFKSIAMRWFINIFLIVAVIICAFAVAFSVVFNTVYTERMEDLANDYAYEFYALSGTNRSTFKDTAISIAGEFKYKNKIEVQVIDADGTVIVSTAGFQSQNAAMPDFDKAMQNGTSAIEKSETADGENIMAGTTVLYDSNGGVLGAYRWITSLASADRMMGSFVALVLVAAIGILSFCAFSGLFFYCSIFASVCKSPTAFFEKNLHKRGICGKIKRIENLPIEFEKRMCHINEFTAGNQQKKNVCHHFSP